MRRDVTTARPFLATRPAAVVCAIVAGTLIAASPAVAGWVIDQVVQESGATSRQRLVFEADRMKTLVLDASGNPRVAVIVDLGTRTITQVDYLERRYVSGSVDEHIRAAQEAHRAALAELAQVRKQIEKEAPLLPPPDRATVEQMLRDQAKQATSAPPDCSAPRTELRKTGRRATIAGYEAIGYDLLADGKRDSEVWIAPRITAWRELDGHALERFASEMARLPPCGADRGSRRFGAGSATRILASEGFAVRTVVLEGGTTQEVVKVEHRPVPVEEFEPPPGFERQALTLPR